MALHGGYLRGTYTMTRADSDSGGRNPCVLRGLRTAADGFGAIRICTPTITLNSGGQSFPSTASAGTN